MWRMFYITQCVMSITILFALALQYSGYVDTNDGV